MLGNGTDSRPIRAAAPLHWIRAIGRGSALEPSTRALAMTLASYADGQTGEHVRPGVARLIDDTGMSKATVHRHLDKLLAAGYLRVTRASQRGRYVSEYALTVPASLTGETHGLTDATHGLTDATDGLTREPQTSSSTSASTSSRTTSAGAAPDSSFDDFMAAYPRKEQRQRARRAWTVAAGKADPRDLIAAARRFATDPNLPRGDDARYVPNAHTWLEDERWNNGPLPTRLKRRTSGPSRNPAYIEAGHPASQRSTW